MMLMIMICQSMFTRRVSILVLVLRTKVLVLGATVLNLVLVLPLLLLTTSLVLSYYSQSCAWHSAIPEEKATIEGNHSSLINLQSIDI